MKKIVDKRRVGKGYEYKVHWKGTWLPRSELENAKRLLRNLRGDDRRSVEESVLNVLEQVRMGDSWDLYCTVDGVLPSNHRNIISTFPSVHYLKFVIKGP